MAIDLGPLQLDEEGLLNQLRQDLKDDWFPDPLGFEDIFSKGQIESVIERNFRTNEGSYKAERADLLNLPKPNFTLRYGLETGLPDRALYHGLVARLVPYYDPLLPWSVFNHRANVSRKSKRYLFRNPIEQWDSFLGTVNVSLQTSPALLSTDLSNYYENINLSILETTLINLLPEVRAEPSQKGEIRATIRLLFECLKEWCYTPERGLPQNRDASSFLGNMYMLPVDRAMSQAGYRYFRYMDDIKIACRDIFQGRRAIKQLILALREIGLSVNSGKTRICAAHEREEISRCLDVGDSELRQISAIWNTRSLKPISRSFSLLKSYTLRLLREGAIDSRGFRFCIRRLEVLANCPEFSVPPEFFADITPGIISALETHPSATDQLTRYLRAVPVTTEQLREIGEYIQDSEKTVYTWQCYRLWCLLVLKRYFSTDLMAHALSLVTSGLDNANLSGAVLYAGALGQEVERRSVAEFFKYSKTYLAQRSSILAVQELPYPVIRQYVQPTIRTDLINVYRGLERTGVYMREPIAEPITNFIDLGRDYD